MLTMNHHPLHTNKQYAEDTQFGQRIVSGPFVYSLVFGMTVPTVSGKAIANLATTDLRHTAPVFHGDTLQAQTEVLEVRESRSQPDRGIVTVHTTAANPGRSPGPLLPPRRHDPQTPRVSLSGSEPV